MKNVDKNDHVYVYQPVIEGGPGYPASEKLMGSRLSR